MPLPDEIVLLIFSFLSPCDISRTARVCQSWNAVASHQSIWKRFFFALYPMPAGRELNWRSTLKRVVTNDKLLLKFSPSRTWTTFGAHQASIDSIYMNYQTNTIITGSDDHTVKFWNPSEGSTLKLLRQLGNNIFQDLVVALDYAPSTNLLLAGCFSRAATLLNMNNYTINKLVPQSLYEKSFYSQFCVLLGAQHCFLGGDKNGTICMYDVSTGTLIHAFSGSAEKQVVFHLKWLEESANGLLLATTYRTIQLFDTRIADTSKHCQLTISSAYRVTRNIVPCVDTVTLLSSGTEGVAEWDIRKPRDWLRRKAIGTARLAWNGVGDAFVTTSTAETHPHKIMWSRRKFETVVGRREIPGKIDSLDISDAWLGLGTSTGNLYLFNFGGE